ncbi:hypothetical protein ACFX13_011061 [Malus domestica]
MATVTAWQLPYRILAVAEEEEDSSSDPTNAVAFLGLCLVLGIACRHLLLGTRVPYTVALLILGIGLGSIEYGTHHQMRRIGAGIRIWANIDPDLLLAVFLVFYGGAPNKEVYSTNDDTSWSGCSNINLCPWICFEAHFPL